MATGHHLCNLLVAAVLLSTTTASAKVFTNTRDVTDCVPTKHGTWTATSGGLVLVGPSGTARGVWTAVDGLPGTRVHTLLIEGSDMWIGTERGLAKASYSAGTLSIVATVKSKPVRAITRHQGALYIGTWGDGVRKLNTRRLTLSSRRMIAGNKKLRSRVTALASHANVLWAATAGSGLYHGKSTGPLRQLSGRLQKAYAWSLLSRDGALWIGTLDGTYRMKGAALAAVNTSDIRDFTVHGGKVTGAAFGSGAVDVASRGTTATRARPSNAVYVKTITSNAHGMCLGGKRGLWTRTNTGERWQQASLGGPTSNDISALAIDGTRVLVGMFDRGLGVYERGGFRAIRHKNLDHHVNGIAIERGKHAGQIWVATNYGLSMIHKGEAVRFTRREGMPSNMVLSVTALQGGGVLAGTARGGVVIKNGRTQIIGSKHSVMGNVWAVAEATDGSLWLGTTLGAYHGRVGKRWTRYSVATGHLANDWVTAIATKENVAWIGTYNSGVTRIDLTQPAEVATHIGGGWINPSGLHIYGDKIYAATMDGALVRTIGSQTWRPAIRRSLGKDTTVAIRQRGGLWVASRRGLLITRGTARP